MNRFEGIYSSGTGYKANRERGIRMSTEPKKRNDAWSTESDKSLVDIVLNHIRTGKTQLTAFEEASQKLGRTPSACGFRWNGVLRKRHVSAVKKAMEKARSAKPKQTKESTPNVAPKVQTVTAGVAMQDVVKFLLTFAESYEELARKVEQLQQERDSLKTQLVSAGETYIEKGLQGPITDEQLVADVATLAQILWRFRGVDVGTSTKAK